MLQKQARLNTRCKPLTFILAGNLLCFVGASGSKTCNPNASDAMQEFTLTACNIDLCFSEDASNTNQEVIKRICLTYLMLADEADQYMFSL